MPIPKINDSKDRLMWKYSRIAYKLLTEDFLGSQQFQQERKVWTTIWKAHVPLRIINFVWKLLHDSLPTKATLHNRGISNDDTPYVMLKKRLLHICFSYVAFLELVGLDRILVCILLRSPMCLFSLG